MALKTLVKVSGITNLSDARYCAGMGVEFLGFSPDSSTTNYMELSKYKEIVGWLSGTKYVGELTQALPENLEAYDFDALQIHDENLISEVKLLTKPIFFVFEIKETVDFENFTTIARQFHADVDYFLLKSTRQSWEEHLHDLKNLCTEFPIILDFTDITAENVNTVLEQLQPDGIGLQGEEEISPGLKDFDGLADVLEALEEDDVW